MYEPVAINSDERAFFIALGGRIARLRKDQDITQAQLAELIGVTQQTINSYETGRRRVPVSLLPAIAKRLGIAVEALLTDDSRAAAGVARHLSCNSRWIALPNCRAHASSSSCRSSSQCWRKPTASKPDANRRQRRTRQGPQLRALCHGAIAPTTKQQHYTNRPANGGPVCMAIRLGHPVMIATTMKAMTAIANATLITATSFRTSVRFCRGAFCSSPSTIAK